MIQAGFREGVEWAKTATQEQKSSANRLLDLVACGRGGDTPPLERLYYALYPEHFGHWDKAATFWSQFEIDDPTNFMQAFGEGVADPSGFLNSRVDVLVEDYREDLDCGNSIQPIGDEWTVGELLALHHATFAYVVRYPQGLELGKSVCDTLETADLN